MKRVVSGKKYYFNPVGLDIYDSRTELRKGEEVRVVNLPGCPRANTMGHCHVNKSDGSFGGLVLTASLTKEKPE